MQSKIFLATIINPISDTKCEFYYRGALVLKKVKQRGNEENFVVDRIGPEKIMHDYKEAMVYDLGDSVIMPGFFDMHFHWVQDDVREMPKDSLLSWLEKYTFPAEMKFKNKKHSEKKAKFFFERLLKTGTIGGACYSSIHEHALDDAFKYAVGDYVIGNVLMTMNSPKGLLQTQNEAQSVAAKMSKKYKKRYALTPRFAIATDPETMSTTAKDAKKNGSFIQTHLSETVQEIDFVTGLYKEMKGFEKIKNYTDIYKKCHMLGKKTIMGHAIHMTKDELELMAKTQTKIAHCPSSNAPIRQKGLGSGLFDFKKIEKAGIDWALASDIGGGPFLSMLDVIRSFVDQNERAGVKGATYQKALYRSTLAGAKMLELDKIKGNLASGKEANFIVMQAPRLTKEEARKINVENLLHKLINRGRKNRASYDGMVKAVYLNGTAVV
jgi:guanine deaminase